MDIVGLIVELVYGPSWEEQLARAFVDLCNSVACPAADQVSLPIYAALCIAWDANASMIPTALPQPALLRILATPPLHQQPLAPPLPIPVP